MIAAPLAAAVMLLSASPADAASERTAATGLLAEAFAGAEATVVVQVGERVPGDAGENGQASDGPVTDGPVTDGPGADGPGADGHGADGHGADGHGADGHGAAPSALRSVTLVEVLDGSLPVGADETLVLSLPFAATCTQATRPVVTGERLLIALDSPRTGLRSGLDQRIRSARSSLRWPVVPLDGSVGDPAHLLAAARTPRGEVPPAREPRSELLLGQLDDGCLLASIAAWRLERSERSSLSPERAGRLLDRLLAGAIPTAAESPLAAVVARDLRGSLPGLVDVLARSSDPDAIAAALEPHVAGRADEIVDPVIHAFGRAPERARAALLRLAAAAPHPDFLPDVEDALDADDLIVRGWAQSAHRALETLERETGRHEWRASPRR